MSHKLPLYQYVLRSNPAGNYMFKVTIEILEEGVKYVQS